MLDINKIYNGDCIDLIKKIPNNSINSIITDPPYFLGVTHNGQKGTYSDLAIMKPFFSFLFSEFKRVLKYDGSIYICCDWRTYPFFYPIINEYIEVKNLLVWDKNSGPGNLYSYTHELIIFTTNNKTANGGKNIINIKSFNSGAKKTNGEKIHPTQKPIELFEKFILDSTKKGDIVLDCFGGSGTLAISAIKTERNYIIFELQEKYCKIANDRISNYQRQLKLEL